MNAIIQALQRLSAKQLPISVAQLSMVEAAQQFERAFGQSIHQPVKPLAEAIQKSLLL
ncbi:hypothetical protein MHB44_21380 [Lysinibacillus sp. FSL H8-0500]|uniref:hypothetical protein n=1 Tax=Lysinibacillus sp. FSL H8-0500 TaxID=2921393 RepID=UPI0031019307